MGEETKLKSGDVVVLKSGGPQMTIDKVGLFEYEDTESAICVWFQGTEDKSARFQLTALQKI